MSFMHAARSSPGFWAQAIAIKKVKIRSIVFEILVNWVGEGSAKFEIGLNVVYSGL